MITDYIEGCNKTRIEIWMEEWTKTLIKTLTNTRITLTNASPYVLLNVLILVLFHAIIHHLDHAD